MRLLIGLSRMFNGAIKTLPTVLPTTTAPCPTAFAPTATPCPVAFAPHGDAVSGGLRAHGNAVTSRFRDLDDAVLSRLRDADRLLGDCFDGLERIETEAEFGSVRLRIRRCGRS